MCELSLVANGHIGKTQRRSDSVLIRIAKYVRVLAQAGQAPPAVSSKGENA